MHIAQSRAGVIGCHHRFCGLRPLGVQFTDFGFELFDFGKQGLCFPVCVRPLCFCGWQELDRIGDHGPSGVLIAECDLRVNAFCRILVGRLCFPLRVKVNVPSEYQMPLIGGEVV